MSILIRGGTVVTAEGTLAAEAAMEAFLDHELARIKERARRHDLEPEEWVQASRVAGATMGARATATDVKALADALAVEAESLENEVRHFLADVLAA